MDEIRCELRVWNSDNMSAKATEVPYLRVS